MGHLAQISKWISQRTCRRSGHLGPLVGADVIPAFIYELCPCPGSISPRHQPKTLRQVNGPAAGEPECTINRQRDVYPGRAERFGAFDVGEERTGRR